MTTILEQREGRALAALLGGVGAGNAATVAGQIDARDARAAGDVALRQELLLHGIPRERNFRQIGELRFGAQTEAESDAVAVEPALRACRVVIDEG